MGLVDVGGPTIASSDGPIVAVDVLPRLELKLTCLQVVVIIDHLVDNVEKGGGGVLLGEPRLEARGANNLDNGIGLPCELYPLGLEIDHLVGGQLRSVVRTDEGGVQVAHQGPDT